MMNKQNRVRILDVPERRALAAPLGVRDGSDEIVLEGYASTYEEYDCYGGTENGGWVEQLDRRAFDTTLKTRPDVQLLINHEGLPLARTTSGTLKLSADDGGLRVRASLNPEDSDVKSLVPKMRRGDVNEMSFGFRVKNQKWNRDYSHRLITEVSLHKGDVSVVNYGMNPTTSVQVGDAVGMIAQLSNDQLAELRKLDEDVIRRAMDHLAEITGKVALEIDGEYLLVRSADGREIAVPVGKASATRGARRVSPSAGVTVPGMGDQSRAMDAADKTPGKDEDEEEKGANPFPPDDEEGDDEDKPKSEEDRADDDTEPDPEDPDEDDEDEDEAAKRQRTLENLNPPRAGIDIADARRLLRDGDDRMDLDKARALFGS